MLDFGGDGFGFNRPFGDDRLQAIADDGDAFAEKAALSVKLEGGLSAALPFGFGQQLQGLLLFDQLNRNLTGAGYEKMGGLKHNRPPEQIGMKWVWWGCDLDGDAT